MNFMFERLLPQREHLYCPEQRCGWHCDCSGRGDATKVTQVFWGMTLLLGEWFVMFQRSVRNHSSSDTASYPTSLGIFRSRLFQVVTCLTCIWLVSGSYLSWGTIFPSPSISCQDDALMLTHVWFVNETLDGIATRANVTSLWLNCMYSLWRLAVLMLTNVVHLSVHLAAHHLTCLISYWKPRHGRFEDGCDTK